MSCISVVIPCHNQAQYLAESIESVLQQTLPAYEILVVDDGSTDNTRKVGLSFPKVSYIYQKHVGNHTPARAMNTGILQSSGNFIVCLAADDKLSPNYLERCLAEFTECSIGIVFTGCQEFGKSDKIRTPRVLHHRYSVFREPHGQIGAMMVRREVYENGWIPDDASYFEMVQHIASTPEAIGGYDTELHSLEDWDLVIRAGLTGWKIRSIPAPLHYARVHAGRTTSHANPKELWRKYPAMPFYAFISRGFDALAFGLQHPKRLALRIGIKVLHRKLAEPPTGFQHIWVNEKRILRKVPKGSILDCGCGVGRWGYLLNDKHYVVGVDISKLYLLKAIKYEDCVLADLAHLPVKPDSFDCGLAVEVVEHLPKKDGFAFLADLKRSCRKIVLTTPKNFEVVEFGVNHPETHKSHWTREELTILLEKPK